MYGAGADLADNPFGYLQLDRDLSGPDGVLTAILVLAARDLSAGGELAEDAADFFMGDWFATIIDWLGLRPSVIDDVRAIVFTLGVIE